MIHKQKMILFEWTKIYSLLNKCICMFAIIHIKVHLNVPSPKETAAVLQSYLFSLSISLSLSVHTQL